MTNSEARKRAQEAASVQISGVGAPNSPEAGPTGSASENGAQGNSQDSGAIGRLSEVERAVADLVRRVEHRRGLIADADWPEHLAIVIVRQCFANLLREHTDRAWDEGYMRGRYPWTDEAQEVDPIPECAGPPQSGRNANPYRAARQEQS